MEDDAILALDMIAILSNAGADVIGPAMNVARAVKLAEEDLHCAVLDVRLNDELVFPAAGVLERRGVNILFYTGQIDREAIGLSWPTARVLAKPAPIGMIVQAVAEACGKACPMLPW